MTGSRRNKFIEFYGKHHISPVHQDIKDFRKHLLRRQKLYRLLGLAPAFFKEKKVLEVGPGGGYNSLVLFAWGARLDFVEPNLKAQEELPKLLQKYHIGKKRWHLHPCRIEDYRPGIKYDLIIAEGFMPGLDNKHEVAKKIAGLVNKGGVVVTTCIDDLSFFFEIIRRVLAQRLLQIKEVAVFPEQVEVLSSAFASHLRKLKFVTRPVEDWVADNLLNPAAYGTFSMVDCLKEFGNDFMLLGSSPAMFTDYSWYKNIEFDAHASMVDQFYKKMHLLLLCDLPESSRSIAGNKKLAVKIAEFRRYAMEFESKGNLSEAAIGVLIAILLKIRELCIDIDARIGDAVAESIKLLSDKELNEHKIARASKLIPAFGRGQQYISLVKQF